MTLKTLSESHELTTLSDAVDDRFRLLVESVHDYGIIMLDPAGNIVSWNPGAEKSNGYKSSEIVGRHVSCLYSSEDVAADKPQRALQIALAEGRFEEEAQRLRKGGELFWAVVAITKIESSTGQHLGFANVTRDISGWKRAEAEKQKLLVDLNERVKELGVLHRTARIFQDESLDALGLMEKVVGQIPMGWKYSEIAAARIAWGPHAVASPRFAESPWRQTAAFEAGGHAGTIELVYLEERAAEMEGPFLAEERSLLNSLAEMLAAQLNRRQATAALRASEERFRAFMENSPAIAFIKAADGRYLYVNATWKKQFDPPRSDWVGKTDYDFWSAAEADRFRASDEACLTRNGAIQMEETAKATSGEEVNWMVMKFPLEDGPLRRVGGMGWDITARKRAEEALELRDRAIQAITQGILITDPHQPDNPIIYASPSFLQLTGYSAEEVVGRNCRFLQGKDTDPATIARIREAVRERRVCREEVLNYCKDGTPFWDELAVAPVYDANGNLSHFVGVQTDVTQRRRLEDQFHQAQKMEAVGQLAAGVAHDFNNLLTVISGYSEVLLELLPEKDFKREALTAISDAGTRAAGLTRQLLAFSRRAVLETKVLDLNAVVAETESLLRRMIGEDILIAVVLDPNICRIKADPGQIGQVLMNLAVNARDAMPLGGKLTIETADVHLDETFAVRHAGFQSGHYVRLAVSDSGTGMTPEVKKHIFEPFFTTKGIGKGTGLGLATVFGIVQQSGGSIDLYSEPGLGTTFKIYLPAVTEPLHPSTNGRTIAIATGGTETILLVEDDDAVREIATFSLQAQGYVVLPAESGTDGIRIIEGHDGVIDLLVTDVVMPGMSGRELAETLCVRYPGLKVLYLSGYTDDTVIRHGILEVEVAYLQKPYTPLSLARKVREVLDRKPELAAI